MGLAYLSFRRHAKTRHGIHSPFIYDLTEKVLRPENPAQLSEIESLRNLLLKEEASLDIQDLGAGSKKKYTGKRKIRAIARMSASPPSVARLLHRLVDHYNLGRILELGTNLGLTTAYLASAKSCRQLISLEGDPGLADLAKQHLKSLKLPAEILTGSFETLLLPAMEKLTHVDLAYIDGNHRKKPTLDYFYSILPYLENHSVIAIGDIHWSAGMEDAWSTIKSHPSVYVTVDLFYLGLVFFRKELSREHFIIKFP